MIRVIFLLLSIAPLLWTNAAEATDQYPVTAPSPLVKLNEPELKALPKGSTQRIYRLTIAPTWGNRFCFRIQNFPNGAVMILKRLEGQAGYGDGPLAEQKEYTLSATEFAAFEDLVSKSGYYKMVPPTSLDELGGCDGDTWTMECARAELSHKVERWCPNAYDPKTRGTEGFVMLFRWAADKAGVTKQITNKGHPIFDR